MPDISPHEFNIQALKNGTYRTLGLSIGSYKTINPGDHVPKTGTSPSQTPPYKNLYLGTKAKSTETKTTPTLSLPPDLPNSREEKYTVISLDLDAPFISFNFMSPIAHMIQTDMTLSTESTTGRELKSDTQPIAPWAAANPPPGAAAHRYIFHLYRQTSESKGEKKTVGLMQRIRFDLDAVVQELGLGEVVGVNYCF